MNLTIKTIKGEQFTVSVEPTETVTDIKTKISTLRDDHAPERQKLIHAGKVLKDNTSVSELGVEEGAFIVLMLSGKKAAASAPSPTPVAVTSSPAPAPASTVPPPAPAVSSIPVAPVQATPSATPLVTTGSSTPAATPTAPTTDPAEEGKIASLVAMGFPEAEARAALNAAMGNADMAVEFLTGGIPPGVAAATQARAAAAARTPASTAAPPTGVTPATSDTGVEALEAFRAHPQFNQLKQLVQSNPAAISQVTDAIGRQNPQLLEAIHANHDAFVAMMNEPITSTPAAPAGGTAPPAGGAPVPGAMPGMPGVPGSGGQVNVAQIIQLLAALPPEQRTQMAQSIGIPPEQLNMMMQLMQHMPPEQVNQMLAGMGGSGGGGDGDGIVRLSDAEMASVNNLMELGFTQQAALQAFIACDKNESLAANFLLEGGFGGDDDNDMMGEGGGMGGDDGGDYEGDDDDEDHDIGGDF